MKRILELLAKKYPADYGEEMNPALLIYDDESGRIIKNASQDPYNSDNLLFDFSSIEELINHLEH